MMDGWQGGSGRGDGASRVALLSRLWLQADLLWLGHTDTPGTGVLVCILCYGDARMLLGLFAGLLVRVL